MPITLAISGESGSGKTHFCGTAEELGPVLYVWFPTVQPDNLLTLGDLDDRPNIIPMPIQKFDDLLQIPKMVREVKAITVVIDPIDFAQDVLIDELREDIKYTLKTDTDRLSFTGYGVLKTRLLGLIRSTNALPCHKIYTTLVQRRVDMVAALEAARNLGGKTPKPPDMASEDDRPYKMESALEGAVRSDLWALMGPAGYTNKSWHGSRVEFELDFRPHPALYTNDRGSGLETLVNPKFKEVVDAFSPKTKEQKQKIAAKTATKQEEGDW